jgi:peptide subunit release factor 1 (eRF1)
VLSLYLNTQADEHGRDRYDLFLRGALPEHGRTYRSGSPERKSFDEDVERINRYLQTETARLADELVTKAQQTDARIIFIEDRSLLADVGGVGALLRFRV